MTTPGHVVQEFTPKDLSSFYAELKARTVTPERLFLGKPIPEHHKGFFSEGFFVRGKFELTLRNAETGNVDWHHEQDNLTTELARYQFWDNGFTSMQIGFVPSTETPVTARSSISTDPSQCFYSGNLGAGSVNPSTYTRQYSVNFSSPPPANRTLGCVCWAYYNHGVNGYMGPENIAAYALLTPPKTQTTLQTLEVVYKISINPIY